MNKRRLRDRISYLTNEHVPRQSDYENKIIFVLKSDYYAIRQVTFEISVNFF